MELDNGRFVRRSILALFFFSGACGLVYEVVWMRMLTLVFGATALATSTILASFFAGLALGSWSLGRVADRSRHPLARYALLEAGIGLYAFAFPLLLSGVTAAYVAIAHRADLSYSALTVVRFILATPVLLLPATLMGGTLPVIVKFVATDRARLGLQVGLLYALNTLGAVTGAFAAGFFLILLLGVREAAYLAGAVNLAIAGVAFLMSRRLADGPASRAVPDAPAETMDLGSAGEATRPAAVRLSLWAVGLSGVAALALEVLWTRALVYFLDNSTHAFTTVLTAFLLGIALGSAMVSVLVDRRVPLLGAFGAVELLIGFSALLAIPVLAAATPVLGALDGEALDKFFLWKWSALRFMRSLTVMLLPTVLMGMTVPLAAKICTRQMTQLGRSLGHVYAANTIGGVVGSVLAGFVIIPLVGVSRGIVAMAALSLAIGCVLLCAEPAWRGWRARRAVIAAAVALVFAGTAWLTRDRLVLASYRERADGTEVLFYREGVGSTVKVFRDAQNARTLSIDGFPVAGTTIGMLDAQESLGNYPLLLSNVASPRVNLIGFGAGGASWEALQYDVATVDCVELVPGVIEAASWFPSVNHDVLTQPSYRLIMGDGRNYALVTDRVYDVIAVDATSPKMAGNGSLYTLEFFELLNSRLSDDGLVVQWLPFHLLSDAELKMTARTFMQVFPHTTLWLSPLKYHGLLVGSRRPLRIDLQAVRRKLQRPSVQREMARVGVTRPLDFLSGYVMGEDAMRQYVAGARLNTDNRPYLEFTPAWSYFLAQRYALQNLTAFRAARQNVLPLLTNTGDTPAAVAATADSVTRRFEATQHSFLGDILYALGKSDRAWEEWNAALRIDLSDSSATRAMRRSANEPAKP